MQSVGQLVRDQRHRLGLSLQDLAINVGCAKSYLSEIENERRESPPSDELLERIAKALRLDHVALLRAARWQSTPNDVRREVLDLHSDRTAARRLGTLLATSSIDQLHQNGELHQLIAQLGGGDTSHASTARSGVQLLAALPRQVPVINKVAAGYPREFTDLDYPARVADEYVSVPDVYDADAFAARVIGDSMEPAYHEGDIVVFSPTTDITPGKDCFARFDPDVSPASEATFKRIYFETSADGRELIRLQPLNPSYPPKVVPREEIAGLYAAVYVVRPIGK